MDEEDPGGPSRGERAARQIVGQIPAASVPAPGRVIVDGDFLVSCDLEGELCAAQNRCRHQGGRFGPAAGPILSCPRHGWRLDVTTMHYVDPVGGLTQPQLEVVRRPGGSIDLCERRPPAPWEDRHRPREALETGELTVTYLTHACAEIRCGVHRILTDPWLEGPAFTRGWWLAHLPPPDWPDRLARADVVYLSHSHSDHLHLPTLTRLAIENPDVTVLVPDLPGGSCDALARRAGLRHVVPTIPGTWIDLDADTRLCLLPDGSGRQDTALLVDHRGHLVLDTVDCSNPNNGVLPPEVDVLMAPFAGGASGYPLCWPEQYPEQEIQRRLRAARRSLRSRAAEMAEQTSARFHVPFAGSFTEAHPADADVRRRNKKNRAAEVAAYVAARSPTTRPWIPLPGATLDVATGEASSPADLATPTSASRAAEFARFLPPIAEATRFAPLADLDGVDHYRRWLGFEGDLVLHLIETDEAFATVARECTIDFANGAVRGGPPSAVRERRSLRVQVRSDAFRHVARQGLGWEEFSVGFQARFLRTPDRYEWDFWDHVQNHLPTDPPWPEDDGSP